MISLLSFLFFVCFASCTEYSGVRFEIPLRALISCPVMTLLSCIIKLYLLFLLEYRAGPVTQSKAMLNTLSYSLHFTLFSILLLSLLFCIEMTNMTPAE